MPGSARSRRKRQQGSIEPLPSGALRVAVYAGIDPVSGRRHYLREIVRAGPNAEAEAEKVMRRLAGQVDEQRNPRTSATLDQLLDRYLETLDIGRTTHRMYAKYLEKHVRPFVGRLRAAAVDGEVLDSLYGELRRCRTHCTNRTGTDHRTQEHECDERCRPHACKPLAAATIRHIHFVLHGAQQRRIALDPETVTALTEHWDRCCARAVALGLVLSRDAFVFSLAPDGRQHLVPSSVSQRYSRLARRLGVDTHLHGLRHYSATELIGAGVDVRTVAGRLGHSGGGVTTLRVYAAWLAEADQRAAGGLLTRLPSRPAPAADRRARVIADPQTPRERIAAELYAEIASGARPEGSHLPGIKAFATANTVSSSTVHRAYELSVNGEPSQARLGNGARLWACSRPRFLPRSRR